MRVLVVGLRATGAAVVTWLTTRGADVTVVEEQPGQPGYDERRAPTRSARARPWWRVRPTGTRSSPTPSS